ncbi:T-complex protein 11 homolog [Strix aluco]|uniref:T-complex protein 11 homolog n=1 Tax=Strix aluco TaxID=111821 RepID=UPI003DA3BAC4
MAPTAAFTAVLNLQFTVSHPRETFRVLGLMKMDILNFTIQSLGTHLQEHNVPYEGKKFQELLDKLPCCRGFLSGCLSPSSDSVKAGRSCCALVMVKAIPHRPGASTKPSPSKRTSPSACSIPHPLLTDLAVGIAGERGSAKQQQKCLCPRRRVTGGSSSSRTLPSLRSVLNRGDSFFIDKRNKWTDSASSIEGTGQTLSPLHHESLHMFFSPYVKQIGFFTELNVPAARQLPSTQLHRDITALLHGLRSAELPQLLFLQRTTRFGFCSQTLFRDQARLQEEQAQVNQFTIRAAVLLVTRAMCGSTFCGSPAFVARLKWVTKVLLEGLSCQIKNITVKGNAVWHITANQAQVQGLFLGSVEIFRLGYRARAESLAVRVHCLTAVPQAASVLQERLFPHGRLAFISYENKFFLFPYFCSLQSTGFTPSSVFSFPPMNRILKRFPQGLDSIQEELLEVGCRFGSTIHHSRQVFGLYYSEILRKVLLPDAGMDSF